MNHQTRRLRYFFSGQNFSDGVRTTVAILLPALLLAQWGHFEAGLTICDRGRVRERDRHARPGRAPPQRHAGRAGAGGASRPCSRAWPPSTPGAGPGNRGAELWAHHAAGVGRAGRGGGHGRPAEHGAAAGPPARAWPQALPHAGLLLLGGLWYVGLALLAYQVRPYRPAQQALGECIHALARFLDLKARFYNPATDLEDDYRQLVAQQVVVNEKQEAVRDLLFRTRQIVNESTSTGRRLVLTFVETVDLYERITVGYYDYAALRAAFGPSGVLAEVARPHPARRHRARPPGRGHSGQPRLRRHRPRCSPPSWDRLQARISALDAERQPAAVRWC